MPVVKKISKTNLIKEIDELMMEGWADNQDIGTILDSMPADLRNAFLNLKFDTPVQTEDGYSITFRL
jgi:hypothetical protein